MKKILLKQQKMILEQQEQIEKLQKRCRQLGNDLGEAQNNILHINLISYIRVWVTRTPIRIKSKLWKRLRTRTRF